MNMITDVTIKTKNLGLLFGSMLLMALVTTYIVSTESKDVLLKKSYDSLVSARESKVIQIEKFFHERMGDIHVLANTHDIFGFIDELNALDEQISIDPKGKFPVDNPAVKNITKPHESFFKTYVDDYGYYDIFLINPTDGHVVYSQAKESDYGANLTYGSLKDSGLAEVFNKVKQNQRTTYVDMAPYAPSANAPTMFIGTPVIENGEFIAVLVLQISDAAINEIMHFRAGYGKSQEDYLVGENKLMRSDSLLDPAKHSIKASFANPSAGKVDTTAVNNALSGKTGIKMTLDYNGNEVLSAYKPLKIGQDLKWVILSEIDKAEVMIAPNEFRNSMAIAAVIIFIIALTVSIILLNIALVRPLKELENRAKDLAEGEGDLTQRLNINGNNEIAEVAKYINGFIQKVQETIVTAKETSSENSSISEELARTSLQIGQKAEEESSIVSEVSNIPNNF